MKVKSIRPAGRADVFNMEVADTHDFAVNGGVIVHNCYDELRYVCMKNPVPAPVVKTEPPKAFDPLSTDDEQHDKNAWWRNYGRWTSES